jgi:hypothetical protein
LIEGLLEVGFIFHHYLFKVKELRMRENLLDNIGVSLKE